MDDDLLTELGQALVEGSLSDERKRDQRLMVYAQTSCPSVTFGFRGLTRLTALAGGRADFRSRVLAANY